MKNMVRRNDVEIMGKRFIMWHRNGKWRFQVNGRFVKSADFFRIELDAYDELAEHMG